MVHASYCTSPQPRITSPYRAQPFVNIPSVHLNEAALSWKPLYASSLKCKLPCRHQMSENVVIGLDGGGSKSRATIVSLNEPNLVLSRVKGGPSNWNSEGSRRGNESLAACVEDAISQAGIQSHQIKCVSCGISGVNSLRDVREYRKVMRSILQRHNIPESVPCYVYNDAIAALAAATTGSPHGVSVVVGTGTITLGMSDHASHRAAGWGPAFRDPGCGFDIGQRGLAAAAASVDGRGPRSALEEAIPVSCHVDNMLEAMRWAYKEPHSWSRVAGLAPSVIQCAKAGDSPARDLLQECAVELAKSVKAVWSKVAQHDCTTLPLALSGGLLDDEKNSNYRTMVIDELQRELPVHDILMPKVDAAVGAALLGRHYFRSDTPDDAGSIWHGVIDEAKKPMPGCSPHVASSAHASHVSGNPQYP